MASYYVYNPIEERMEIVIDDVLVLSFPHDDDETGHTYLVCNSDTNHVEYYSGGVLVRSYG